jgi:hypothetical protein
MIFGGLPWMAKNLGAGQLCVSRRAPTEIYQIDEVLPAYDSEIERETIFVTYHPITRPSAPGSCGSRLDFFLLAEFQVRISE